MLSAGLASKIEASSWFKANWAPYLLVDADLRIRGVNPAYERATAHARSWLVGERLFDVFPDNPADPAADGVANLSSSLERVFRTGARHWMGVQRYDVPDPYVPGSFVYKVWAPVNSPVKDGGRTVAVLHHVQDVTAVLSRADEDTTAASRLTGLQAATDALWRQFPDVPREAVLGVLTHSQRVVIETLGAPDLERASALARLRLEARTGHPPLAGPPADRRGTSDPQLPARRLQHQTLVILVVVNGLPSSAGPIIVPACAVASRRRSRHADTRV